MAKDVRGMLKAMSEGTVELANERPEVMAGCRTFMGNIENNGVLDVSII